MRLRLRIALICLALAVLASGFAFSRPGIQLLASLATGTQVAYGSGHVSFDHATLNDVTVASRAGEPILRVAHLNASYNLHAITFSLDAPQLTLIRHRDGSWNYTLPARNKNGRSGSLFDLDGAVRNGRLTFIDQTQGNPALRETDVLDIGAGFHLPTKGPSRYHVSLAYVENGRSYRLQGRGDLNPARGYSVQRFDLPAMPIAKLINIATDSPSLHLASGSMSGASVQVIGLPDASGQLQTHVSATTNLQNVRLAIGGLVKPVRSLHGRIDLYDDGLTFDGVDGTLANVPLHVLGGIYGFGNPQFRLALQLNGDLADLRQVVAQTSHLPMRGAARVAVLLEGSASNPVAMIALDGAHLQYGPAPIEEPHALVALNQAEFDVLDIHAGYQRARMDAQGRVALTDRPNGIDVIARLHAPSGSIPYASMAVPGMAIDGWGLAAADTMRNVQTHGILRGATRGQQLSAGFAVSSDGVGTVGPLIVDGSRGTLFAGVSLDHAHNSHAGFIDAQNFRIAAGTMPASAILNGNLAGRFERGRLSASGNLAFDHVVVNGAGDGTIELASALSGTQTSPRAGIAVVVHGVNVAQTGLNAFSSLDVRGRSLLVRDTAINAGPGVVVVDGTIANATSADRRYDLRARTSAANIATNTFDASVDANVHVGGSGTAPIVAGTVDVPTGSINGQAFRNLHARLNGTPDALAFSNGGVMVDTTRVSFNGVANAYDRGANVNLSAPHADLSDFNDLFDTGETLGGTGSLALSAAYAPDAPILSSGLVHLHNARFRRFDVGTLNAAWRAQGASIAFNGSAVGNGGSLLASGTVNPSTYAVVANARARDIDLQTWLPIFGINEPLIGRVDADGRISGRFPNVDSRMTAYLVHGNAYGIPVQQATIAMRTSGGRGTIDHALVRIPYATADASGSFGLHDRDPLALVAHVDTPDVGAVAREAGIKSAATLSGRVRSTVTLRGTRDAPLLADATTIDGLRYQQGYLPHATMNLTATTRRLTLQQGIFDLAPGRVTVAGSVPLPMRDAPFNASVIADNVELAQFASWLPAGTRLSGRLDGRVVANGRTNNPQFAGMMTLAQATYSSPEEEVPVTGATAQVILRGTKATLRNARANVGGGTVTAFGSASIPSISDTSAVAANVNVTANGARVDLPAYYKGIVDANVAVSKVPGGIPIVAGSVAVSSGRLPLSALYNPSSSSSLTPSELPLGFNNLQLVAGNDVRVQSPNVDIGAAGSVTIAGTLGAPQLSGRFESTGGTLSFYRDFAIEHGSVAFDPDAGIMPRVNAVATTYVSDPDTMIRIRATGPADDMQLGFASDPAYSKAQILAILAGIGQSRSTNLSASGEFSSLAEGQINTVFQRSLLEPLSTALGGAFGFNNVELTNSLTGGFGARFAKILGKNFRAVFADSFGEPRRESLTLETINHRAISMRAMFYQQDRATIYGVIPDATQNGAFGANVISIQPMTGTNGVDFSLERKFP